MAAQRFPVPFLLTPPVTASKDFESLYLKDYIVSAAKDDVKARFLMFCEAVWQASKIGMMEAQTIRSGAAADPSAVRLQPQSSPPPEILRVPDMIRATPDAPA
jgi:hypothetical protein